MDLIERARRAVPLAGGAALGAWFVATWQGGGRPQDVPPGLSDAGPVAAWGLRMSETGSLVASVVTVGSLLVAAHLAYGTEAGRRAQGAAGLAALVWVSLIAMATPLRAAEALGLPLGAVGPGQVLAVLTPATEAGTVALVALALTMARARARAALTACLLVALAIAVTLAVGGHAAAAADDALGSALLVHVVAALLWTGGLAGLLLHATLDPVALRAAVPKFSRIALGAYVALAASGVLAATATRPLSDLAWSDGYSRVVLAKVGLLVVLGGMGIRHRHHSLRRLEAGHPRAFLALASGEVVLMGVGLGLAAALSRTPPPVGSTPAAPHGHTGDTSLVQLTWTSLWTEARPNSVVLVVLGVALAGYLSGVRGRARLGTPWPTSRTACFVAGLVLALVLTCSGVAAHAHTRPSVLVSQLLLAMLAVPALLLAGRPLELLPPGRPGWLLGVTGWLSRPATGAIAVSGLLLAVQYSAVVSLTLGSPWWHLVLLLVVTGCGLALWWPHLAAPQQRGAAVLERAGWLATVALALAVVTVRLRLGSDLLAADWFLEVRLSGADPLTDQRRAGLAAGVAAVLVGLTALVVAVRQSRPSSNRPGGHNRTSTTPRSSSAPIDP